MIFHSFDPINYNKKIKTYFSCNKHNLQGDNKNLEHTPHNDLLENILQTFWISAVNLQEQEEVFIKK